MKLNQCHCVVTGVSGATGKAIRARLLQGGATVVGTVRPREEHQRLKEQGRRDYLLEMNPLVPESIHTAIQLITREMQQIHVWINVIGGFYMGENIENSPPELWERMYAQNFLTTLQGTRAILAHFKKSGFGRLINFGATAVSSGMPQAGPYLTSKAAVHALTKATAAELEGDITCNAILPAIIDTQANREAMPGADTSSWVKPETIAERVIGFIQNSNNGELVTL